MADLFNGTVTISFDSDGEWVQGTDYPFTAGSLAYMVTWKGITYIQYAPNSDPNASPDTLPSVWAEYSPTADNAQGIQFTNDGKLAAKINTSKGIGFDTNGNIELKIAGSDLEFDQDGNLVATLPASQPIVEIGVANLTGQNALPADMVYTDAANNQIPYRAINIPIYNASYPCSLGGFNVYPINYTSTQSISMAIKIAYFSTANLTSSHSFQFDLNIYTYSTTNKTATLFLTEHVSITIDPFEAFDDLFVTTPQVIGENVDSFIILLSNLQFPIANAFGITNISILPILQGSAANAKLNMNRQSRALKKLVFCKDKGLKHE